MNPLPDTPPDRPAAGSRTADAPRRWRGARNVLAVRLDNLEIATRLSISVGTVKIHLHHVYEKLQLRGRHDLQVYLRDRLY